MCGNIIKCFLKNGMTALIMRMRNIYPHIGHMAFQILIRELQIELLVIHYFIF